MFFDGIDSALANEWTAQTVPLVCSAIRAAVRIAITGTEGAAERIEVLCSSPATSDNLRQVALVTLALGPLEVACAQGRARRARTR